MNSDRGRLLFFGHQPGAACGLDHIADIEPLRVEQDIIAGPGRAEHNFCPDEWVFVIRQGEPRGRLRDEGRRASRGTRQRARGRPDPPMRRPRGSDESNALREVLVRAGIEGRVRPFHDLRHTAITNDAASGNSPASIMKHAGHSDFKTTQRYIDLSGVTFREEAERAERRLLGEFVRATE